MSLDTLPPARGSALPEQASGKTRQPWTWAVQGLFVIALILLVREAKPVLLPVVAAVALTFALAPPVRRLHRAGIPETIGAAVVLTTLLLSIGLLGSTLVEPAAAWWQKAPTTARQLVESLDRLRAAVPLIAPPVARKPVRGQAPATPAADPVKEKIASESVSLTGRVLGQVMSFGVSAMATVILLYFLLASERWLLARTMEAIPQRRVRALILGGVGRAQQDIGLYLATMAFINLALGVATGLALAWIGLPNPVLWGSITCVLNFIPYLGPLLISVMLLLAGILTFPTVGMMLAPPAAFLALHGIESNFISPVVVGHRLVLSPLSVFLSVMFWGWLWGIAGAMVAVPILLVVRMVCRRRRSLRLLCVYLEGRGMPPSRWRP